MNLTNSILLFSNIIEPFIWLYSFDRMLKRKKGKHIIYLSYALGDWAIAFIRNYITSKYLNVDVVFTLVLICYVLVFVYKVYDADKSKKFLLVGLLFLLSLSSDFIVIGILMLLGQSVETISSDGIVNAAATVISKGVFFILISLRLKKEQQESNHEYEEYVPIIFGTILYELPSVVIFNKIYVLGDNEFLLILFVFGELIVLCLVIYAVVALNKKKRMELELRTRIHDIEIEISSNKVIEDTIKEINHFRHDIKSHLIVLEGLLNEGKLDSAKKYLQEIKSGGLDIVEALPGMRNKNVGIVLGQRKKHAEEVGVAFFPEIMVEDYTIKDKDICSVLCNLLDNAIEAASKCKDGYVNIIIKPDAETRGFFIECYNNYKIIELKRGKYITTKTDKENHGFGIDIVKKIVSNYHGKCYFNNNQNSHVFSVEIYIPGSDVNDQHIDM